MEQIQLLQSFVWAPCRSAAAYKTARLSNQCTSILFWPCFKIAWHVEACVCFKFRILTMARVGHESLVASEVCGQRLSASLHHASLAHIPALLNFRRHLNQKYCPRSVCSKWCATTSAENSVCRHLNPAPRTGEMSRRACSRSPHGRTVALEGQSPRKFMSQPRLSLNSC